MRCYAFILASMYRYSWLVTFKIFQKFFLDRGVGGWGVSYPNFFGFLYIFIFTRPLRTKRFCSPKVQSSKTNRNFCRTYPTVFLLVCKHNVFDGECLRTTEPLFRTYEPSDYGNLRNRKLTVNVVVGLRTAEPSE